MYVLNILDGFSYFSMSLIFVMIATELFGYSDTAVSNGAIDRSAQSGFCFLHADCACCVPRRHILCCPFSRCATVACALQAGTLYGLWGVGLSMYQLAFGFIIDALGVKRSFILSCILTAIGR